MNDVRNRWQWSAVILTGLLAIGCGKGSDSPATYAVHGTATYQNKPMQDARITLVPISGPAKEKNALPRGTVDEQGNFTLSTYTAGDGAPAGNYKVVILWPKDASGVTISPNESNDRLGDRYSNVIKSTIEVTIEAKDDNTLPPIELR